MVVSTTWRTRMAYILVAIALLTLSNSASVAQGHTISVLAPTAGETIIGGTTYQVVAWDQSDKSAVTFDYSLNNGLTWRIIGTRPARNHDSVTMSWSVPDSASTRVLVRATTQAGRTGSSGMFTIRSSNDAGNVFTRPTTGEVITAGTQDYQIMWNDVFSSVKTLSYSSDGGATWVTIAVLTGSVSSYSWDVPLIASTQMLVRIIDGNGKTGTSGIFTIRANNDAGNIFTRPTPGEIITAGTQDYQIMWNDVFSSVKTLAYSSDGGITWYTIAILTGSVSSYSWDVPNIGSTHMLLRIIDSDGKTGTSGMFTVRLPSDAGIIFIRPAAGEVIVGGTQNYQVMWNDSSFSTTKTLSYSLNGGATWHVIGLVTGSVSTYSWDVPDTVSNNALLRLVDNTNRTGTSGVFRITSSREAGNVFIRPVAGEIIPGGLANYQIQWNDSGFTALKTLYYSSDGGITWTVVAVITGSVTSYSWNVPNAGTTQGMLRIVDNAGRTGTSGIFTVRLSTNAGNVFIRPAPGEVIIGGTQNYQVIWNNAGFAPIKTLWVSLDGGFTWNVVAVLNGEVSNFSWDVPDTSSPYALMRLTDHSGRTGTSGVFTIRSDMDAGNVFIRPVPGEVIAGGTQNYQVIWNSTGFSPTRTLMLSLDGGFTWTILSIISGEISHYSWDVPDTASSHAMLRIVDNNGRTGTSGVFTITSIDPGPGSIVVTRPAGGEVLAGGSHNYLITFTSTNTTPLKILQYSLDGGASWNLIGFLNSEAQSFNWADIPNVATTQALVRVSDANGVSGTSGLFTITMTPGVGSINSLTLSGLDTLRNIDNDKQLGISWTYTPEIGTFVEVEYSLDYTLTWHHITTVLSSETTSATWTTPMTGEYNPVFIRVTSSNGSTRTSAPFSIGTAPSSVTSAASNNGYAVSNYPNPASDRTTINVVLPAASEVTLTIVDALGRTVETLLSQYLDAGVYAIPVTLTRLGTGMYDYILQTATTRVVGRLTIVK